MTIGKDITQGWEWGQFQFARSKPEFWKVEIPPRQVIADLMALGLLKRPEIPIITTAMIWGMLQIYNL